MKKSVLTAFITVVCATSSVMAADDNAITDGSVTFNGKVIAAAGAHRHQRLAGAGLSARP